MGRCLIHWATGPLGKGRLHSSYPQSCKGCSGDWAQDLSQGRATRPSSQLMWRPRHPLMSPLALGQRSVVLEKPDLALGKSDAPFQAKFCPVTARKSPLQGALQKCFHRAKTCFERAHLTFTVPSRAYSRLDTSLIDRRSSSRGQWRH